MGKTLCLARHETKSLNWLFLVLQMVVYLKDSWKWFAAFANERLEVKFFSCNLLLNWRSNKQPINSIIIYELPRKILKYPCVRFLQKQRIRTTECLRCSAKPRRSNPLLFSLYFLQVVAAHNTLNTTEQENLGDKWKIVIFRLQLQSAQAKIWLTRVQWG